MKWLTKAYLLGLVLLVGCSLNNSSGKEGKMTETPSIYQVEPFPVQTGWGYDIYAHGRKIIHQEFLPAIGGNRSCNSYGEAKALGNLVVFKIQNGISPPSLSKTEVDSVLLVVD